MPKPRKPTALLALNGGLATNPGRYADRLSEPNVTLPIGSAPSGFSKAKRAIWDEVAGLVAPGVLQRSDRIILELITHLIYDLRTGQSTVASIAQLRMALASLGMTPSDRSRVSAAPQDSPNDPLQFLDS
ncbi:hypothetical protein AciX8_1834 [Granulicella mallensis MP5ACTX8]|uniref:Uncharacterized protein n=1 Tax=Granulicella mallensis (strain ATCC BAA-1857 / DSM 23137 / MP5ACTX8) TaxID=682795 RepID=G8NR92_GRAMM|nr:hypothetical protein AciX8_1834 [Granulicella mallensis MP5ACTX8]